MQIATFSVLLAVLAATSYAYVLQNVQNNTASEPATLAQVQVAPFGDLRSTRANLNLGSINVGDRLLYSVRVARYAIANTIQYQDVIYRGNTTTRLRGIFATEQGFSQNASAWLIAGGLGWSNATVRVQSLAGRGYDYYVQFWGL